MTDDFLIEELGQCCREDHVNMVIYGRSGAGKTWLPTQRRVAIAAAGRRARLNTENCPANTIRCLDDMVRPLSG